MADTVAVGGYRTFVQLDEGLHQRQADAEPALATVDGGRTLLEQLEQPREKRRADTGTVVLHGDRDLRGGALQGDVDQAAAVGVLRRVRQQVGEHLHQPGRVAVNPNLVFRQVHGQAVAAFLKQRFGGLDGAPDHLAQLEGLAFEFQLALNDAGCIQQVIEQVGQVLGLALDDLMLAGKLLALAAQFKQVQHGDDRRQRIAQLVPEHGEEFILGATRLLALMIDPCGLQPRGCKRCGRMQERQLGFAGEVGALGAEPDVAAEWTVAQAQSHHAHRLLRCEQQVHTAIGQTCLLPIEGRGFPFAALRRVEVLPIQAQHVVVGRVRQQPDVHQRETHRHDALHGFDGDPQDGRPVPVGPQRRQGEQTHQVPDALGGGVIQTLTHRRVRPARGC